MRLAWCLLLCLAGSCTTTATITTSSLGTIEARINGGDEANLFVTTEGGLVRAIPRAQVREIDHPGNVLVVVGGILGGTGALDLAIASRSCAADMSMCVPIAGMGVAGVGLLTWGLWTWLSSRFAVDPPPHAAPVFDPPPPPEPPPLPPPSLLPSELPAL